MKNSEKIGGVWVKYTRSKDAVNVRACLLRSLRKAKTPEEYERLAAELEKHPAPEPIPQEPLKPAVKPPVVERSNKRKLNHTPVKTVYTPYAKVRSAKQTRRIEMQGRKAKTNPMVYVGGRSVWRNAA